MAQRLFTFTHALWLLAGIVILASVALPSCSPRKQFRIEVAGDASADSFQVYFTGPGKGLSESNTVACPRVESTVRQTAGGEAVAITSTISFSVPADTTTIRLDWMSRQLSRMVLTPVDPGALTIAAANQVVLGREGPSIVVTAYTVANADDPWILFTDLPATTQRGDWGGALLLALLLGLTVVIATDRRSIKALARPAPLLAITASALLTVLFLWTSRIGTHPDELNHIQAASYFVGPDAWSFPDLRSTECLATIGNAYRHSYLFDGDVAYLLVGKLTWVLQVMFGPDLHWYRMANLLIFAGCVGGAAVALGRRRWLLLIPLAVPQVWYVASYVNGDNTGLGLALLAVALAIALVERIRLAHEVTAARLGAFLAVCGLVLCAKLNFAIVSLTAILVVAAALALHGGFARVPRRTWLVGLGCLLLPLLLIKLPYYHHNGYAPGAVVRAIKEEQAPVAYKPSVRSRSLIGEIANGKGIETIAMNREWHASTLRSFVGGFGYMLFFMPFSYVWAFWLALLGIVVVQVARFHRMTRRPAATGLLAAGLLASFAIPLAQSLFFSITWDYQAQGRYIFPFLPLLVLVLGLAAERLRSGLVVAWSGLALLLLAGAALVLLRAGGLY